MVLLYFDSCIANVNIFYNSLKIYYCQCDYRKYFFKCIRNTGYGRYSGTGIQHQNNSKTVDHDCCHQCQLSSENMSRIFFSICFHNSSLLWSVFQTRSNTNKGLLSESIFCHTFLTADPCGFYILYFLKILFFIESGR